MRRDTPSASPREISSRSANDSTRSDRHRLAGTYPPLEATTPWIEPGCLPSARPISLRDSPAFHRLQSSRFCPADNPGRPRCAIRPPPGRDHTILGGASTGRAQGRSLEDLHILPQPLVLPAQGRQLLALRTGQPAVATPHGVPLGLAHPLPDRSLSQVEVSGDPPDRAVTALAQLDDLGLELRRERPTRARLLAFHGLHDGHPPRGNAPDGGCPSKRARPKAFPPGKGYIWWINGEQLLNRDGQPREQEAVDKVKLPVCIDCNSILARRFEQPAKPLIRSLLDRDGNRDGNVVLSGSHAMAVACWCLKTWLLLAHPAAQE